MDALAAFQALATPEGRADPYPYYEALRGHGNLVPVKDGTFVAVGYRECAQVLRDPRLQVQDGTAFDRVYPRWREHSSVRAFTNSMLYTNPPRHGRQRGTMNTEFTPQQVARLTPVIVETISSLFDRVAELGRDGSPVDLMAEFATRLPIAVVSALLGFDGDRVTWFRDLATSIAVATDGFTNPPALAEADAAMDELAGYFVDLVARKRGCPAGDLVSGLVGLHDTSPEELSYDELLGNMMLLLTAGFETTAFLVGDGALLALSRPEYARRLADDESFVDGYVEEVARFEPPVHVTSRWAARDVTIAGVDIPAGARVVVVLAAGNRDPGQFGSPNVFDPERAEGQPLSFGGGVHFCLGAALARLEVRTALPLLVRRFPGIALGGVAGYRDRWVIRGLRTLPVVVGARRAA